MVLGVAQKNHSFERVGRTTLPNEKKNHLIGSPNHVKSGKFIVTSRISRIEGLYHWIP